VKVSERRKVLGAMPPTGRDGANSSTLAVTKGDSQADRASKPKHKPAL